MFSNLIFGKEESSCTDLNSQKLLVNVFWVTNQYSYTNPWSLSLCQVAAKKMSVKQVTGRRISQSIYRFKYKPVWKKTTSWKFYIKVSIENLTQAKENLIKKQLLGSLHRSPGRPENPKSTVFIDLCRLSNSSFSVRTGSISSIRASKERFTNEKEASDEKLFSGTFQSESWLS